MKLQPSGQIWLLLLAGPGVGFLHLMLVYGLESATEAPLALGEGASRAILLVATLAAAAITTAVALAAWRNRLPRQNLTASAGSCVRRGAIGVGALLSLVTVLWQGLPALMVG